MSSFAKRRRSVIRLTMSEVNRTGVHERASRRATVRRVHAWVAYVLLGGVGVRVSTPKIV